MPATKPEEKNLVERAKNGDVDAFGVLYKLHLDEIYRYIFFRVSNDRDAEDLTEQVFLNVWEALPEFEYQGKPFTSWVYRIAHNIVIDYYRSNNKKPVPIEELHSDKLITDHPTTLQKVIENEEYQMLANAISKLTDEQQQVIILRFIEGFSHREVAEVLDKNEGACRMIQFRALKALKESLLESRIGR